MFKLGKKSLAVVATVKPDLQRVVKRAIELTKVDFCAGEGIRSKERQKELYKQGASKTLNSKHLTGDAIDLVPFIDGRIVWNNDTAWQAIADAMFLAAAEEKVSIAWGGHWKTFVDKPHFELKKGNG